MAKRKPRATQPRAGKGAVEILQFDPANANRHTEVGLSAVQLSVARLGAGRSIVADSANTVVAGEATLKAAQQLGMPTRIVETDGTELIVVRRTDLKPGDPRRRALAIADNQTAKLSDFDETTLVEQLRSLGDCQDLLTATGFSDQELMNLMAPSIPLDPVDTPAKQVGDVAYRVVVSVADASAQEKLIARLESEGYECQPLMS